jgi:hypothetical protein
MATGQYTKQNLLQSDADVTTVRATAAPTASYVASTEIDCRGFREVDFFVDVATVGSITKLTSGVSTTNEYEVELNDPSPASGVVYKVTVPVEGRYVRVSLKSDSATGTVGIYALRRV